MTADHLRVAIVGRQNVGKSTLLNRIVGRRVAISHDTPGVTRDTVEREADWRGRKLRMLDTAGYLRRPKGLEALAAVHAERASAEADVLLLVVDVRIGVTEEDADLARRLRRGTVPVLLVANKVDSPKDAADVSDLHRLGLGEPVAISALHGQGVGDLLDRVLDLVPESTSPPPDLGDEPRFAIVGRPNVGKSSLFNRIVGSERSIVSEVSGTTRDTVDSLVEWSDGIRARFVDTAGMRRGLGVRGIEYYSFLRASRAIDDAHVVALVIDASQGLTSEDGRIAAKVVESGKALLIVANKWDLVEHKDATFKELQEATRPFAAATAVRTSATRGQGVHRLPPILLDLYERWMRRSSTAVVNDVIRRAQAERPTPRSSGNLHYATQVSSAPPTVVVFGGSTTPPATYRRYLENRLRRELGLEGIPIRLLFRGRRPRGRVG